MKKILVIGKNGYVANCFKEYMKKYSHYEVTLITARNNAWKDVNFKEYDAVFNTVGLTHNDARAGSEEEFYALNAELPFNIASKAKDEGVSIFINMSSSIVYGNMAGIGENMEINSNTCPVPDSIYGKSKLEGERKLFSLQTDSFKVVAIRSPLIYGVTAPDNVEKLIKFALKMPCFPNLDNSLSMIYDEDLCELVRLIIENKKDGIFYPQMDEYISTSKFVKDIAIAAKHKLILTKIFNPVLKLMAKKYMFVQKAFGNQTYEMNLSNSFDGKYRILSYKESIEKIAKIKKMK